MNLKKIISRALCLALAISCISTVPTFSNTVDKDNNENNTTFEYKLTPGMKEWGELNHGERVLASQIPLDDLQAMSTTELVNAVVKYPCFIDMIFYDSYQEGFEVVKENFNGLQELFKREDAGEALLNTYKKENLEDIIRIQNKDEQFDETLELLYIETMIAQPEITSKMSEDNILELSNIVEKNYNIQKDNMDKLTSLSFSGYYDSLAEQQNVEPLDYVSYVKTPRGTSVQVLNRTGYDKAYAEREQIKRSIEINFPGAQVVGDATIRYNCHAYAWAGNTSVWMNNPSAYWNDGSYTLKSSNSPSAVGQKAYYGGSGKEHSGNVIRLSGNSIKSKWGDGSLVEHSVTNCPYFFIPLSVKFYG